jgi:hypothetical protein
VSGSAEPAHEHHRPPSTGRGPISFRSTTVSAVTGERMFHPFGPPWRGLHRVPATQVTAVLRDHDQNRSISSMLLVRPIQQSCDGYHLRLISRLRDASYIRTRSVLNVFGGPASSPLTRSVERGVAARTGGRSARPRASGGPRHRPRCDPPAPPGSSPDVRRRDSEDTSTCPLHPQCPLPTCPLPPMYPPQTRGTHARLSSTAGACPLRPPGPPSWPPALLPSCCRPHRLRTPRPPRPHRSQ